MKRLLDLSLVTLAFTVFAVPLVAEAQREARIPRIGFLNLTGPPPPGLPPGPTVQRLRDLGYVEGATIAIERRYAGGPSERLGALAQDLLERRVDVIVTTGAQASSPPLGRHAPCRSS